VFAWRKEKILLVIYKCTNVYINLRLVCMLYMHSHRKSEEEEGRRRGGGGEEEEEEAGLWMQISSYLGMHVIHAFPHRKSQSARARERARARARESES
jgi:hypothetical protein